MVLRGRRSPGQTSVVRALHGILTGCLAISTRALQHALYGQLINEGNRILARHR